MSTTNEIKRTYAIVDGMYASAVSVMIYEPLHPGNKNRVGIVLQHSDDCYFEFLPAVELARRGYVVAVSYFPNPGISLDRKLVHVGKVVSYLREYPGVEHVVLLGHSGGATMMSAYQAVAENGNAVFQDDHKIIGLSALEPLTPADGVMFLDANLGNGVMSLLSLDPAIIDERDGTRRDPALDMFLAENGYGEDACNYSDAFVRAFVSAQGARMNRLIAYAQERVAAIDQGGGSYLDDEPMIIPGGAQLAPYNKLFPQCPERYFTHTKGAWDLLTRDDRVVNGVVPCLRARRRPENGAAYYHQAALVTTVRTFLRSSAVLTTEDLHYDESGIYGVDWDSSYCTGPGNAAHIKVPMLLMGMTGSYEYIAAEQIYQRAVECKDKTLAFVEGAGHNFTPAADAEQYPGEFGDTAGRCMDYVDQWLARHYIGSM